jgi:acyl-coenzyme A thioesterase PaaI-like protein
LASSHLDFESMLDLRSRMGRFELPFHERLIGAVSLPAVHGGATAASLALSACHLAQSQVSAVRRWQPLTVTVHYLRAVRGESLIVEPVLRKPGTASCEIGVSGMQSNTSKQVVHAECLLVQVADQD